MNLQKQLNPKNKESLSATQRRESISPQANILAQGVLRLVKNAPQQTLKPSHFEILQQTIGNQAVQRLVHQRKNTKLDRTIQRTLLGAQRDKETADLEHGVERLTLSSLIEEGLRSSDERLRNSCEWLKQGITKLYALTPTHDSDERVEIERKKPGSLIKKDAIAYFSYPSEDDAIFKNGEFQETEISYDPDKASNESNGIFIEDKGTAGFRDSRYKSIAILGLNIFNRDKKDIFETIKHEVQHDADHHKELTPKLASANNKLEIQQRGLELYMTESRAFSYQGIKHTQYSNPIEAKIIPETVPTYRYPSKGDSQERLGESEVTLYHWNQAQWEIVKKLFAENYDDFVKAWLLDDQYHSPGQRPFQQKVVAFKEPLSINPKNSVRVEAFYNTLRNVEPTDGGENYNVLKLLQQVEKLNEQGNESQEILNNPEMSQLLIKHLGQLNTPLHQQVRKAMLKGNLQPDPIHNPYIDKLLPRKSDNLAKFLAALEQVKPDEPIHKSHISAPGENSLLGCINKLTAEERLEIVHNPLYKGILTQHLGADNRELYSQVKTWLLVGTELTTAPLYTPQGMPYVNYAPSISAAGKSF